MSKLDSPPETLHLPRILCLQGGGLTAHIFKMQMRLFTAKLSSHFRLVFVEAPFESEVHHAAKVVFDNMGPYSRWFRWEDHHPSIEKTTATEDIEDAMMSAMVGDAGSGEWVGLLGFSQGATVAASILLENQVRRKTGSVAWGFAGEWWKFGIFIAGYARPASLSEATGTSEYFTDPGSMLIPPPEDGAERMEGFDQKLNCPTFHVSGLQDPDLRWHRLLFRDYCREGTAKLFEFDDGHRVPFRTKDVDAVLKGISDAAAVCQRPLGLGR
ncbi:hypothetical protein DOTSEDRAFT_90148 [Dothistroma septosporum NZE10]|uniref:Serine hydrolase domain-containing protein n=1 Tax=Dothistroma septosporum (strain NZE10 / CBS 128990) TaxID=675120 RepID=N1PFW4_DOTSN|nr:hypothetical protein DOTSEDRAFT_90148 [Dothistroma septosporum NZE10]